MDQSTNIRTSSFKCRNIYADLFIPVYRRPGFEKAKHPIMLVHQAGVQHSAEQESQKVNMMLEKLSAQKMPFTIIDTGLTFRPDPKLIQAMKSVFETPIRSEKDIEAGIQAYIKEDAQNGLFGRSHHISMGLCPLSNGENVSGWGKQDQQLQSD